MSNENLLKQYELTCNELVTVFCRKHDFEFDHWLGGVVGERAVCSDMVFSLKEICYDINNNVPYRLILQWYKDTVDANGFEKINFKNYTKGIRYTKI